MPDRATDLDMERALRKEDDNELPPDVVKSALDKEQHSYMTSS